MPNLTHTTKREVLPSLRVIAKPGEGEYPAYAHMYIDLLPDDGLILKHLDDNLKSTKKFVASIPKARLQHRYAEGITQKIISVSSFGVLLGSSANPKQSPLRLICSNCLPPAQHQGIVQREFLSPLRRRSDKTRAISAPQTSCSTRLSSHPPTERMSSLGVGSGGTVLLLPNDGQTGSNPPWAKAGLLQAGWDS